MTWQMAIVLAVLAATFAQIVTEKLRAELASVGACCVLLLARVQTPAEVFPLFASEAVITVGAMFVLSAPLAIETARLLHADPRPFLIGVTFGASACFATPIGYQANTLIFSAGGCRFWRFSTRRPADEHHALGADIASGAGVLAAPVMASRRIA